MTNSHETVLLDDVLRRMSNLEGEVAKNRAKIASVAEDTSWIRGFLNQNGTIPDTARDFKRDVGIASGSGGLVGLLILLAEKYLA